MSAWLERWRARASGRREAACSVPPFDGVLKPNQRLETAPVLARFERPADLASDGRRLWLADGRDVLEIDPTTGAATPVASFGEAVTALACDGQRLAVALGGKSVRLQRLADGALQREWRSAGPQPFVSVNALSFSGAGLLATEGSARFDCDRWCHDLMSLGHSGRLCRLDIDGGASVLRDQLAFPFGALTLADGSIWMSESWRHRLVRLPPSGAATGARASVTADEAPLDRLPGYPSRLAPAAAGGAWLTVFACRTQLVELVLREPEFRQRMVAEIDPAHWVAPALSSGRSFLEPLQGGGVKTMGVLKPWAPPRSYGLVIRLGPDGRPVEAMHSRVGGQHHGVVAAVELDGALYALAKGSGCLLRLPLPSPSPGLQGDGGSATARGPAATSATSA